ncbi:NUDIX domain-containing protein [Microbacterium sp. P07]|uniref:NUDIX hydrolase n=1 Tax=Microbacterium sp. P07 TaxID=3366952 RepID=UPI003744D4DA
MTREVHVSAAVVLDHDGRALLVRKRGTSVFMQPGGKPESGETPADTLVRELAEEVGLHVDPTDLEPLGLFRASAANEPGFTVVAHAFAVPSPVAPADVAAGAEIDELRWFSAAEASVLPLAPLSLVLLPLVWGANPR